MLRLRASVGLVSTRTPFSFFDAMAYSPSPSTRSAMGWTDEGARPAVNIEVDGLAARTAMVRPFGRSAMARIEGACAFDTPMRWVPGAEPLGRTAGTSTDRRGRAAPVAAAGRSAIPASASAPPGVLPPLPGRTEPQARGGATGGAGTCGRAGRPVRPTLTAMAVREGRTGRGSQSGPATSRAGCAWHAAIRWAPVQLIEGDGFYELALHRLFAADARG